jgi:hypothetical protein
MRDANGILALAQAGTEDFKGLFRDPIRTGQHQGSLCKANEEATGTRGKL